MFTEQDFETVAHVEERREYFATVALMRIANSLERLSSGPGVVELVRAVHGVVTELDGTP